MLWKRLRRRRPPAPGQPSGAAAGSPSPPPESSPREEVPGEPAAPGGSVSGPPSEPAEPRGERTGEGPPSAAGEPGLPPAESLLAELAGPFPSGACGLYEPARFADRRGLDWWREPAFIEGAAARGELAAFPAAGAGGVRLALGEPGEGEPLGWCWLQVRGRVFLGDLGGLPEGRIELVPGTWLDLPQGRYRVEARRDGGLLLLSLHPAGGTRGEAPPAPRLPGLGECPTRPLPVPESEQLPVFTGTELPLLPGQRGEFRARTPRDQRAVERALNQQSPILVLARREPGEGEPGRSQLHATGTLGRFVGRVRRVRGELRFSLWGVEPRRVLGLRWAHGTVLAAQAPLDWERLAPDAAALGELRAALRAREDELRLRGLSPADALAGLREGRDPLPVLEPLLLALLGPAALQELLELPRAGERLDALLRRLRGG